MGVHQRIDKRAHRELRHLVPKRQYFPTAKDILHFEGLNGPDGIKRKSPGQDEPWHYLDPTDHADRAIYVMIADHMHNLTEALIKKNKPRAAFEAAWLAHAITDGLTPAHHYPLEAKLEELRGGEGLESRNTAGKKIVLPGKNRRHQVRNNWEYWGAKGVMTTHLSFELGIAMTMSAGRMSSPAPTGNDIVRLKRDGFESLFDDALYRIRRLGMYEEFSRAGWTRNLARETRSELIPIIVRTVSLAWYDCAQRAAKRMAK